MRRRRNWSLTKCGISGRIDFRNQTKMLGKKEKGKGKRVCRELLSSRKLLKSRAYTRTVCQQSLANFVWCQEECGGPKPLAWRRPRQNNCEDTWPVLQERSLQYRPPCFLVVNNFQIEARIGLCSNVFLGLISLDGEGDDDMREAWRRQVWEASSWAKSQRAGRCSLL